MINSIYVNVDNEFVSYVTCRSLQCSYDVNKDVSEYGGLKVPIFVAMDLKRVNNVCFLDYLKVHTSDIKHIEA